MMAAIRALLSHAIAIILNSVASLSDSAAHDVSLHRKADVGRRALLDYCRSAHNGLCNCASGATHGRAKHWSRDFALNLSGRSCVRRVAACIVEMCYGEIGLFRLRSD
jgi:hypothetical protein